MFPIENYKDLIFKAIIFLIPILFSSLFFYVCSKLYYNFAPQEPPDFYFVRDVENEYSQSTKLKFKLFFVLSWFLGVFVFFLYWYTFLPRKYEDITNYSNYQFQLIFCLILFVISLFFLFEFPSKEKKTPWKKYLSEKIQTAIDNENKGQARMLIYEAINIILIKSYGSDLRFHFDIDLISLRIGKDASQNLETLYVAFLDGWKIKPHFSKQQRVEYKLIEENLERMENAEEKVINRSLTLIMENRKNQKELIKNLDKHFPKN